MPNHIHFLIKTHEEAILKHHPKFKTDFHKLVMQQLSNLLNSYAKAYNKKYERKGALWIDYTKRFQVSSDNHLTTAINYIHQNPVNHGFASRTEDWKSSSYHSMLSAKPTLLSRNEVIDWFGGYEAYVSFHSTNVAELLEEIEY